MKIGLIGFGSIGRRHYENLIAQKQRVIVFSRHKDAGIPGQVRDRKNFYAQGPYDAIFITNETAKHLEALKKCLPLKPRAFFIEKPVSNSSKGLKQMAEILKKNRISAWVGYCLHFLRPLLEVKKLLKKRAVGRIYALRVFVGQDLRGWHKRDYRLSYSGKKKAGGGVLLDLVHDLNYPAWLLGEPLKPVMALIRKLSDLEIDTEDFAESILISKSGIPVSVHQDYLRIPGKRYLEIIGSKGTLVWNSLDNEILIETRGKVMRKKVPVSRNEMYEKEVKFFLDAIKKKKPFSNLQEAIRDVQIIEKLKIMSKK